LANTPNGTVELRTGKLREHRPLDYITKKAAVGPGGDCPMFLEFLDTVFAKDNDLIHHLQKFFGYILAGETTERHAVFLWHRGKRQVGAHFDLVRHPRHLPPRCADRHFHPHQYAETLDRYGGANGRALGDGR
jgi:hypothetical protein